MLKELLEKITPEYLDKLSIMELESLNRDLMEGQKSIRVYRIAINGEIGKKEFQAEAKRKHSAMSDDQKKALLQELQGAKVVSEETVKAAG